MRVAVLQYVMQPHCYSIAAYARAKGQKGERAKGKEEREYAMYDLRILLIEITQKCNANCKQCGSNCNIHGEELLTQSDIISVLWDIKNNMGTDTMINITGGEPLMRYDLFDIARTIDCLGFDWGMVTNGTLITDEVIDKMKNTHMKTITVSIDGMNRTHDELRQLPGSFNKIIRNIVKLKEANFLDTLQVTFTANKHNVYEFESLYSLLSETGIDSIRVSFMDPIGRAEGSNLLLNKDEMQWLIDRVNKKNKERGLPVIWGCPHYLGTKVDGRDTFECFAGKTCASILYNGGIFVCPNVPRVEKLIQGNIKKDSFSDIWKSKFEYFRQEKVYDKCRGCVHLSKCKGDSLHTFNFDTNEPKYCYKDIFESDTLLYEKYIQREFKGCEVISIQPDIDGVFTGKVYIEPQAYKEMETYFHIGQRHPSSMYEQQMGLIGFKVNDSYIVRYTFPSTIQRLAKDYAKFNSETIRQIDNELKVIRDNIEESEDMNKPRLGELKFIGFIHSHPIQKHLQYSTGDEKIHKKLRKLFGEYIGILINPISGDIGAYGSHPIKQIELEIVKYTN